MAVRVCVRARCTRNKRALAVCGGPDNLNPSWLGLHQKVRAKTTHRKHGPPENEQASEWRLPLTALAINQLRSSKPTSRSRCNKLERPLQRAAGSRPDDARTRAMQIGLETTGGRRLFACVSINPLGETQFKEHWRE